MKTLEEQLAQCKKYSSLLCGVNSWFRPVEEQVALCGQLNADRLSMSARVERIDEIERRVKGGRG